MLVCRIIEFSCLCCVYRWAHNIKTDIIKFIRLLKKDKPGQKLDSMFEEEDTSSFTDSDYEDFTKFDRATTEAVTQATGNGKKGCEVLAEAVHQYLHNCQDFEPITPVGRETEKSLVPRSTFEPAEESVALQSELDACLGYDMDSEAGMLSRGSFAPEDFRSRNSNNDFKSTTSMKQGRASAAVKM